MAVEIILYTIVSVKNYWSFISGIGFPQVLIFFVQEIVMDPGFTLEEVSENIRQKLYNEKLDERFEAWVKELRGESHIKIIM